MDAKTIIKNDKYSHAELIRKAVRNFNAYIRCRDKDKPCISCGEYRTLQAGHFYSAGHYPGLRFNENNVHGQCQRCNFYLSGNLSEYRLNLSERIGGDKLQLLDHAAKVYKRIGKKFNRIELIEIIEKYKVKNG